MQCAARMTWQMVAERCCALKVSQYLPLSTTEGAPHKQSSTFQSDSGSVSGATMPWAEQSLTTWRATSMT